MADEFVKMYNPDTQGVAEATEEAFTKVYAAKGWQRMSDNISSLDGLTQTRLLEIAKDREIDVSHADTKEEILELLKESVS